MNAALHEPKRHKLTRDNYHRMADIGILAPDARVELINGEIIDMVPIGNAHAGTVDFLTMKLTKAIDKQGIVRVQGPVSLGEYSEPEPDLSVLRFKDDFYRTGNNHPSGNDILLLIEVAVSTLSYDREIKIPLYASHQIPEVWLVVPEEKKLHIYSSVIDSQYREVRTVVDLANVAVPGLNNCSVNLSQLFG